MLREVSWGSSGHLSTPEHTWAREKPCVSSCLVERGTADLPSRRAPHILHLSVCRWAVLAPRWHARGGTQEGATHFQVPHTACQMALDLSYRGAEAPGTPLSKLSALLC